MLCLIPARRDKVCPQYRVRNWGDTNTLQPQQKVCRVVQNTFSIHLTFLLSKNIKVLDKLFCKHWYYPTWAHFQGCCTGKKGYYGTRIYYGPFEFHLCMPATCSTSQPVQICSTWACFQGCCIGKKATMLLRPIMVRSNFTFVCLQHALYWPARSNMSTWKSTKLLLSQNHLKCVSSCPTLQTFPSYSRKPGLFGHVVSDPREAWQSVSTISRFFQTFQRHHKNHVDL
jgi:hypothetical protein